ncbi:MAG: sodium:calcium antiporter [Candidatus Bathyarchaeaceae archaeon]
MEPLILSLSGFAISLLLLYFGSAKVVEAAPSISARLGFNKVVVGTVFVASVTAFPELLSSLFAIFLGSSRLALGNIIGSNIYNVPLIIGICGVIRKFRMKNSSINKECFFMIGLSLLFTALIVVIGKVTWWIGAIFIAFYPIFIYYSIRSGNCNSNEKTNVSLAKTGAYMTFGGFALLSGTFLLVYSALNITEIFGLKQFYVGLTIVALGSILPEVAVSVTAAVAGEQEISIGNVIGDNIITITLVLGLVALIRPITVSFSETLATTPFMVIVTVMLLAMNKFSHKVTRSWGLAMLVMALLIFIIQTIYTL